MCGLSHRKMFSGSRSQAMELLTLQLERRYSWLCLAAIAGMREPDCPIEQFRVDCQTVIPCAHADALCGVWSSRRSRFEYSLDDGQHVMMQKDDNE